MEKLLVKGNGGKKQRKTFAKLWFRTLNEKGTQDTLLDSGLAHKTSEEGMQTLAHKCFCLHFGPLYCFYLDRTTSALLLVYGATTVDVQRYRYYLFRDIILNGCTRICQYGLFKCWLFQTLPPVFRSPLEAAPQQKVLSYCKKVSHTPTQELISYSGRPFCG